MLNREEFKKQMQRIKELDEADQKINALIQEISYDGYGFVYTKPIVYLIELLKIIMYDQGDWISYYIYELEWGERYDLGCIRDENDIAIPLQTLDELYDFLVKEKKENDRKRA